MNIELVKKAESLLTKCPVSSVASVSEEGYPRICIMRHLKTNGIKEFWFPTSADGIKVRHFKKNSRAGVTFYNGGDSVTLTGTIEIVTDKAIKDALWDEWSNYLEPHYGGKDAPDYCIIHFVANETTIYIGGKTETFGI